jgi:hypothetical protein
MGVNLVLTAITHIPYEGWAGPGSVPAGLRPGDCGLRPDSWRPDGFFLVAGWLFMAAGQQVLWIEAKTEYFVQKIHYGEY